MAPLPSYGWLLAATVLVELAVVLVLAQRGGRTRACLATLGVNFASHPLAYVARARFAFPHTGVELVVVAVEALGFRFALGTSRRRALGLACACNAVTWALSYVV